MHISQFDSYAEDLEKSGIYLSGKSNPVINTAMKWWSGHL